MHRCRSALIALLCSFTLTAAQAALKVLLVASPGGGAPEPDRHDPTDDHIQRLQADAQATTALLRTRRTQDVRAGEHAAVLVIGGKGAMFDLPRDTALQRLLVVHFESGGVLAAVCHGAGGRTPHGGLQR